MFYRFETDIPLRWVDVDSAGVVNNAVYLSLVEQARYCYFEHLGLLTDHQVPFVVAETTIQFLRPGRIGMRVSVAARTSKIGAQSFHMDYEVKSGDEVLAKARAALVFVDEVMKARAVPDDFRAAVEQFEELSG
jgi:acyl-CoA thioester hydrolase